MYLQLNSTLPSYIGRHVVYVIKGQYKSSIRTYIGYTNNIVRRIRQHNRELCGGAKKTKKGGPWTLMYFISGFQTMKEALSFEWYLAHRPPKFKCKMRVSMQNRYNDTKKLIKKYKLPLWICNVNGDLEILQDFPCHLAIIT